MSRRRSRPPPLRAGGGFLGSCRNPEKITSGFDGFGVCASGFTPSRWVLFNMKVLCGFWFLSNVVFLLVCGHESSLFWLSVSGNETCRRLVPSARPPSGAGPGGVGPIRRIRRAPAGAGAFGGPRRREPSPGSTGSGMNTLPVAADDVRDGPGACGVARWRYGPLPARDCGARKDSRGRR